MAGGDDVVALAGDEDLTPLWAALADEHRPADSDLPDVLIGSCPSSSRLCR